MHAWPEFIQRQPQKDVTQNDTRSYAARWEHGRSYQASRQKVLLLCWIRHCSLAVKTPPFGELYG
jgi:hypothetical protein